MIELTGQQIEQIKTWGEILQSFAFVLGVVTTLLGLFLAWKRLNHAETTAQAALLTSKAANEQAQNSSKQLEYLVHQTERSKENEIRAADLKAIEAFVGMLDKVGSEDKLVRIGTYFALSSLADLPLRFSSTGS